MVEDGRLGRARRLAVVVARDRVQQLGEGRGIERCRPLLDHPQAEVYVAEQPSLLGLYERRPGPELANPAYVVQQRGGEEEIAPQTWVKLERLAAQGRDTDRVLEQATGVPVVPVRARSRKRAQALANVSVADERPDQRRQARVRDLAREEVEEPVELVGVTTKRRRQICRVRVLGRLQRAHLDLELSAEPLDAAQDPHRVPLVEARVQQLDVAPHSRLHATARVRELDGEIRSTRARSAALLAGDRIHAFDQPVLVEIGDRGHARSLREHVGTLAAMADVQPFRAVRYSGAAGPIADLVAPPYDAVDDQERALLYARSPYNVVHLTLPDSAEEAGHLYRSWLSDGVLQEEPAPAAWLLHEKFVGPDGVTRERRGLIASLAAEPYGTGTVLPHERTHSEVRAERLELLRATRVHPEPIFILVDGPLELEEPARPAEVEVDGARLWRLDTDDPAPLVGDAQLLIADGHHRYECAVDFAQEAGSTARIMALLVSVDDPGLRVFPTHRVFAGRGDLRDVPTGEQMPDLPEALERLQHEPADHSAAVAYRAGRVELIRGREHELDVELVDRYGLDGVSYTPRAAEAVGAVDARTADVAFLLREPSVAEVFATGRRGERMPQKSTYFFPKPLSGLLFHPVDPEPGSQQ